VLYPLCSYLDFNVKENEHEKNYYLFVSHFRFRWQYWQHVHHLRVNQRPRQLQPHRQPRLRPRKTLLSLKPQGLLMKLTLLKPSHLLFLVP
jgi:hypothetical protein